MANAEQFVKYLKNNSYNVQLSPNDNTIFVSVIDTIYKRQFNIAVCFFKKYFSIESKLCRSKQVSDELKERQHTFFLNECYKKTSSEGVKLCYEKDFLIAKYCIPVPPIYLPLNNIVLAFNVFKVYLEYTSDISYIEEKPYGGIFPNL